jgi:hypothetical protein
MLFIAFIDGVWHAPPQVSVQLAFVAPTNHPIFCTGVVGWGVVEGGETGQPLALQQHRRRRDDVCAQVDVAPGVSDTQAASEGLKEGFAAESPEDTVLHTGRPSKDVT